MATRYMITVRFWRTGHESTLACTTATERALMAISLSCYADILREWVE